MLWQHGKLPSIVGAIVLGYSAFTTEQQRGELISLLYTGRSKPELHRQTGFYLEHQLLPRSCTAELSRFRFKCTDAFWS